MRATADFDVVGFGTNAVDYLIRVPEYPAFDSKTELSEYSVEPGGEVASTMVGLRRLGIRTAYAGRFGGDYAGKIGVKSLIDEGVNTDFAETAADAKTQIGFIVIDETTGERTIIWKRDSRLGYSEIDAPVELAAKGRILHLTPHDTKASIRLAQAAKDSGGIVSIDADCVFDGIDELLALTDVCITSSDFSRNLFGMDDRKAALSEIHSRFGCAVTGMTLGSAGSLFLSSDRFIETPGFAVPGGCIDTTGAGDAFRAGFLFGIVTGEGIEETARIANAVACLKCRGVGARSLLPDVGELDRFLGGM